MIDSPYLYIRRISMRVLNFRADGQVLKKDGNFDDLYPGSAGYLYAEFNCSRDWLGMVKVAEFRLRLKGDPVSVAVINGRCEIPESICAASYFFVRLIGKKGRVRLTTGDCEVKQYAY